MGERLTDRENDRAWFEQSMAVIWATVVYNMLVPWQLIRFFGLAK